MQAAEVVKGDEFEYLGSTIQDNEQCTKEVTKRVQGGWRCGEVCHRSVRGDL